MKKVVGILLVVSMLFSLWIPASAASTGNLQVNFVFSKTTAAPGADVNMTLTFPNYKTLIGDGVSDEGIYGVKILCLIDSRYFDVISSGSIMNVTATATSVGGINKAITGLTDGTDYGSGGADIKVRTFGTSPTYLQVQFNYAFGAAGNKVIKLSGSNGTYLTLPLRVKTTAPTGTALPAIIIQDNLPAGGPSSITAANTTDTYKTASATLGTLAYSNSSFQVTAGAADWTGVPDISDQDAKIVYGGAGAWTKASAYGFTDRMAMKTNAANNTVTVKFNGTNLRLIGYKSMTQGIISVDTDGQSAGAAYTAGSNISLYANSLDDFSAENCRSIYETGTLAAGDHTVVFTVKSGTFQFDGVQVMGGTGLLQAEATQSRTLKIEFPMNNSELGGWSGTAPTIRNQIGLFSNFDVLRIYKDTVINVCVPGGVIPSGTTVKVCYYQSQTQHGTFAMQIGTAADKKLYLPTLFDAYLAGSGTDKPSNMVFASYTTDEQYEGRLLIRGTNPTNGGTTNVQIDYVEIEFPAGYSY